MEGFDTFASLLQGLSIESPVLVPFVFIIARAFAIIFAPIPGTVIDVPGILVFGWFGAFVYAEIGIMLGAMTAFYIARKFREPLVKRFVSLQKLEIWEEKFSEDQKFWGLVLLRLPTAPLFDYISYAAGLTKLSPVKFFFSTLFGNVPTVFLFFYLGGVTFDEGLYYGLSFVAGVILLSLFVGGKYMKKRWRKRL